MFGPIVVLCSLFLLISVTDSRSYITMSQPTRRNPPRERRSALEEALYYFNGEGISSPHSARLSKKMDLILDSNRRLHGRLRELEAKVLQRSPAPAAAPLLQNPIKRPMRTGADFRNLNALMEDNAIRNELVSFLTCLGGNSLDDFVKRIFFALFEDEIALHVNFKGRKLKESLSTSAVNKVVLASGAEVVNLDSRICVDKAKWLAEKLKPVQRQLAPRSYRDTFEFIDDIKDLNVNGMVMFSLDVSSLFTNVPVTETVDYICDFLSASQQEIGLPTKALKELLLKCTLNVQFLFDNQLYRQVDGVAMGSPLGPLLADVFMGKLERFQLSDQIDKLKHYGRYVDDFFAIATAETDVATLLDAANPAHPSIKFTLEIETAGSLPFLDVLLSRRPDGSVRRSVYRKKTWSGQYMNFASFVPFQQKRNLVRCLAQRARKICSTDSIEEELRKIQDFLRENGYPDRFIAKNIAERPVKPATPTAEKKTLFLKVPFQGDATRELLRRRLDQAVLRTFPAPRVQISFSTNPILRGEESKSREDGQPSPSSQLLLAYEKTPFLACNGFGYAVGPLRKSIFGDLTRPGFRKQ
nr:unnamed protein product [Spirometra erinaceieuropaei]